MGLDPKAMAASSAAKASGDPADHASAAKAHEAAAKAAFKEGDPDAGKQHSSMAKKHRAKGPQSTDPKSPLAAWAESKSKGASPFPPK